MDRGCHRCTWGACLLALLAVLVAGCGGDDGGGASGDEFVIGVNSAQSGYAAVFDQPALEGLRMAAQELNAEGALDGKKIRFVVRNNRSEPAQAAITSRELVREGIDLMISPCDADLSIPAGRITQDNEIPAISPCASTPTYPIAVGDYMFGNMPADNQQGTVLADYALDKGYETAWLLLSSDTEYTQRLPEYFAEVFEAKGGEVVGQQNYKLGTQDFSPQIDDLKAIEPQPDVIMSSSYEPEFPAFMKQLRAAGIDIPVIESDGIDTATLPEVGASVDGVVFTTAGFPKPGSKLADFNASYKEKNGKDPETIFVALGYETMNTIAEAVKVAGTTTGPEVRDAIAGLEDFPGLMGPITYAGTDRMPLRTVAIVGIEGGERVYVDERRPALDEIPDVR
jgi:branched-chain amino acid transport system substrate-binding protein